MSEDKLEFRELFNSLTPKSQAKIILFADLLVNCPGFKADYKAAASEGPEAPTLEVIEALMDKWMAYHHTPV